MRLFTLLKSPNWLKNCRTGQNVAVMLEISTRYMLVPQNKQSDASTGITVTIL